MSRSELHDWKCAIESLCGDNADKMLAIAQDIYNTAFVRGKNCVSLEQTRWIPVSERLPKESGNYFTTISFDIGGEEPVREVYKDYFSVLSQKWLYHGEDVIAWMPLPESYEESEDEE